MVTTYEDPSSGEKLTFVDSRPSLPGDSDSGGGEVVDYDSSRSRTRMRSGGGGGDLLKEETPQQTHFSVVAIDFGTTYSGYAFSFAHEPEDIHVMRKWEGESLRRTTTAGTAATTTIAAAVVAATAAETTATTAAAEKTATTAVALVL